MVPHQRITAAVRNYVVGFCCFGDFPVFLAIDAYPANQEQPTLASPTVAISASRRREPVFRSYSPVLGVIAAAAIEFRCIYAVRHATGSPGCKWHYHRPHLHARQGRIVTSPPHLHRTGLGSLIGLLPCFSSFFLILLTVIDETPCFCAILGALDSRPSAFTMLCLVLSGIVIGRPRMLVRRLQWESRPPRDTLHNRNHYKP